MELRRFIAAHFAQFQPLERERRLLFATKPKTDDEQSGPQKPETGGTKTPEMRDASDDLASQMQRTKDTMITVSPEAVLEGFSETSASTELLHELLAKPGDLEGRMKKIVRKHTKQSLEDVDPGTLTLEQRSLILREMLQDRPEVTLKLLEAIEKRKQDDELLASIDRKVQGALNKRFEIPESHRKILSTQSLTALQNLETELQLIPNERIVSILEKLKTPPPKELAEAEIAHELGYIPDVSVGTQTLNAGQRSVVDFFLEVKRAYHDQAKFGASVWKKEKDLTDTEREQAQAAYRESLNAQSTALRECLDAELSKQTSTVIDAHSAVRREIDASLKGLKTPEEMNEKLLRERGYGLIALADASEENLLPLDDLGLLKNGDDRRRNATHPEFLNWATEALGVLKFRKRGGGKEFSEILELKKQEQKEVETWAEDTAQRLRRLHGLFDGEQKRKIDEFLKRSDMADSLTALHDTFEPYAFLHEDPGTMEEMLTEQPELRITATDPKFSPKVRQCMTAVLDCLERDPEKLLLGQETFAAIEKEQHALEGVDDAEIKQRMIAVRKELQDVFGSIEASPHLKHEICETLDIARVLEGKKFHILDSLQCEIDFEDKSQFRAAKKYLPQAEREIENLKEVQKNLASIDANTTYVELPADNHGYFRDGKITINTLAKKRTQQVTLHHEQGHAILWALKATFPFLLTNTHEVLRQRNTGETGGTLEDLLQSLKEYSSYKDITDQMETWRDLAKQRLGAKADISDLEDETQKIYMENMVNELLARHAEWVHVSKRREEKKVSPMRAKELQLFKELDGSHSVLSEKSLERLKENTDQTTGTLHRRGDEHDEHGELDEETPNVTASDETSQDFKPQLELQEIRREIEGMESFVRAYSEQNPEVQTILNPQIASANSEYRDLFKIFLEINGGGSLPEENPEFVRRLKVLRKKTMETTAKIRAIDVESQQTISSVQKTKKPGFFENMHFMSILDIGKLWKDTKEDFKSIYQRRQDKMLKEVGAFVTDSLGVGGIIPYYGEYFAGLRGYHERRYSGTELEAAKKWEDSMKLIDSHAVLDLIAVTRNRDLVRGGISLLVERGEMDWNDDRMWRTLMRFSGYEMPIEACKRDDILRDTWLKKMVNDIWKDKEQYYHWKQGNDQHIKSHKSEFTPTADQLANVQSGLSNELRKQLKLFVEWGHKGPIPDDVKPHLYEEVLHYAMRNGKMSMQDKFFYLIQGVRHGILSIDRLRVLAGEGGEILLRFPFIDYFYQKNNSFPEVERLGKRLQEKVDKYAPGAKTMYFLQLELPKAESFQHRLSKALGRDSIERIDHEDFPMIVSQIDYKKIGELTGLLSGDRFKITDEALKNSYLGFNSKFKAYARLAEMERTRKARFTKEDVRDIVRSVTSFIHFDNLMTRKAWDGGKRQSLTWNDINHTTAPSSNGLTVSVSRNGAYHFVHALMDRLEGERAFDWNNVKVGDTALEREKFLQRIGEECTGTSTVSNDQKRAFDAIEHFQKELERALTARPEILKAVLKEKSGSLVEEGASQNQEYLSTESAKEFFADLVRHEGHGVAA